MSRRQGTAGLVGRPTRTIPASLLAVTLLVLGGLGVWLLGTYLVNGTWPGPASSTISGVSETSLGDPVMQAVAVVTAVVGLAMILAAIVPGRPSRVPILADDIPGETALSRRDLARRIQRRAENVDGVHSARVAAGPRAIDVRVDTVVDDTAPVSRAATAAVDDAVRELRPADSPRSRVRIHRRN
ncbi:MAG: DUF6286 domain-containing protein [Dietzia sp.]